MDPLSWDRLKTFSAAEISIVSSKEIDYQVKKI